MDDKVICPLVDHAIDPVDCMENRDTKDKFIPAEYKQKKDWKEICKNCKWHNY